MKKLFLFYSLFIIFSFKVKSAENKTGSIGTQQWSQDINITGDLTINGLVTIDAGVQVTVQGNYGITVTATGAFRINGIQEEPVIFTRDGADLENDLRWKGFTFEPSTLESNFDYCKIEFANKDGQGGAIYIEEGNGQADVTSNNCIFRYNSASDGGAISGGGTYSNCDFYENTATGTGGVSFGGDFIDCLLYDNGDSGGDLNGGTVYQGTLRGCSIYQNRAANGGGIYQSTAKNCKVYNNTAADDGGASYLGALVNCVVYNNSSDPWRSQMSNCIIANNTGTTSVNNNFAKNCAFWNESFTEHTENLFTNCAFTGTTYGAGAIQISIENTGDNAPYFINPTTFTGTTNNLSEQNTLANADWSIQGRSFLIN